MTWHMIHVKPRPQVLLPPLAHQAVCQCVMETPNCEQFRRFVLLTSKKPKQRAGPRFVGNVTLADFSFGEDHRPIVKSCNVCLQSVRSLIDVVMHIVECSQGINIQLLRQGTFDISGSQRQKSSLLLKSVELLSVC